MAPLRKAHIKELTPELQERRFELLHRRLARYKTSEENSVLVMLDPKIYQRADDPDGDKALQNLKDLSDFLDGVDPTKGLSLLPCQGWFEADSQQRLYFVFRLPPAITPDHSIHTFRECLEEPFRPSLTERVALAKSLAKTVLFMHEEGYYHKGIQSESIVFFRKQFQERTLSKPFIVGLDFSRKVEGNFWSEKPLETYICSYLHPDLLQNPNRDFSPKYDYYALGVLFVELILFQRIENLLRKYTNMQNSEMSRPEALKIRGILLGESPDPDEDFLREVAFLAGDRFAGITKCCLTGGFGRSHDNETQIITFRDLVVNQLDHCTI